MRKLASIQRIKALEPIDGADAIVKATVLGWELVVKKDEFKVGDLAVYCEIDSLMPDKPEFEFLKPRKMRIRTVRLRGQISQGICFPLSVLPQGFKIEEDADCTEALGIVKYEPPLPACLEGKAKGRFPQFLQKTDETRVQVLQALLDKYKGLKCYVSEKLDGSSATYYVNDGVFGVCSRNLELLEDDANSFWKVARELDIENKLLATGLNVSIQGELIGEGIQSNRLKIRGQSIRFFNVFDIETRQYYNYEKFVAFMHALSLETVPIITTEYILENNIASIVKMATIKSSICPDAWAEGIVIRPLDEIQDFTLRDENLVNGRISFKAINPEFLIAYGE